MAIQTVTDIIFQHYIRTQQETVSKRLAAASNSKPYDESFALCSMKTH